MTNNFCESERDNNMQLKNNKNQFYFG